MYSDPEGLKQIQKLHSTNMKSFCIFVVTFVFMLLLQLFLYSCCDFLRIPIVAFRTHVVAFHTRVVAFRIPVAAFNTHVVAFLILVVTLRVLVVTFRVLVGALRFC